MWSIFKKEVEDLDEEVEYTISEYGLRRLADAFHGHSYDYYHGDDISVFERDMQYLLGVSDTIKNDKRMKDVIYKLMTLRGVLESSVEIKAKRVEHE